MLHRLRAAARALLAAAVLLTLTTTLSACNKVPLIAPSGSSLTVFSTTTVLPVNGSAEIVAVILEGGQGSGTGAGGGNTAGAGTPVHDGTTVMFTTTLGRLDPAQAQTSGGRATVKLVGDGRSGTATITAFSGAARNTVEILIGAAAAARVLLTAAPQSLPPTGGTTTLTARVEDQQGNGLQGVPITFSTTAGTLANGSVISDKDGGATTTLTTTAAATVTARAGGTSATLSDTAAITLKPRNNGHVDGTGHGVGQRADQHHGGRRRQHHRQERHDRVRRRREGRSRRSFAEHQRHPSLRVARAPTPSPPRPLMPTAARHRSRRRLPCCRFRPLAPPHRRTSN